MSISRLLVDGIGGAVLLLLVGFACLAMLDLRDYADDKLAGRRRKASRTAHR